MGPVLKGILPIPIDDHILRKILETEPVIVRFQGLRGISVQQRKALLHPSGKVAGRGGRVRVGLVRQQGGSQERQGDGKDRHPRPEPYAEGLIHDDRAPP